MYHGTTLFSWAVFLISVEKVDEGNKNQEGKNSRFASVFSFFSLRGSPAGLAFRFYFVFTFVCLFVCVFVCACTVEVRGQTHVSWFSPSNSGILGIRLRLAG